jgi:predicted nucleotidyltransferase
MLKWVSWYAGILAEVGELTLMIAILEAYHGQIAELCRRFGVARLDVFGSATTEQFAPGQSDIDFIVRFTDVDSPGIARRFVGLAEALEQLLERPVDLLSDQPFANPYFAQSVAETRESVYAQPDEKAPV